MSLQHNEVVTTVIDVIREMTVPMPPEEPTADPAALWLAQDMGFSSLEVFELLALLNTRFGRQFPYEDLVMNSGTFVNDLRVGDLATFICEAAAIEQPPPAQPS